jgi:RNA polymerase sigma-70 factor (subfamily 1)
MRLDNQTKSLIVEAKLGNKEALNKLFAQHQSRILRIVRFRLSPGLRQKLKLQSMDIVQEVFMYALKHLEEFEPQSQGHFFHWLSKKVEHYIIDKIRYVSRDKRKAPGGEVSMDQPYKPSQENSEMKIQIQDDRPTPSKFAVIKERERLIDSLLEKLKEKDREVIINKDLEQLTHKEIGQMYGKSEDAVRKQYCRAFKKLIDLSEDKLKPFIAKATYKQYEYGI